MTNIEQLKSLTQKKENDFSSVIYIVNNQQRVSQFEMQLADEMVTSGINAILPPDIMSYQIAFLQIAGNIIKGSNAKEQVTEYSNEKQQLLMFEIALEAIESLPAGDPYSSVANNRHHLVSDTKAFLKDIITYMKWDEALKLKDKFTDDSPSKLFLKFFDIYMKKVNDYKGPKFFDIFIAYKSLYEHLKKGNKVTFEKSIIVEDFDDMEPIFKEITSMLEKADIKIIKLTSGAVSAPKKRDLFLYNFMTPLDEAEVIGFKIKEMLADGVKPQDISVVYYNSDIFELLQLVFDRFGIAYYSMEPLMESPVYEAFKSASNAAYGEFDPESVIELLSCESSAFKTTGYTASMTVGVLSDLGYKVQKNPKESVLGALDEVSNRREAFVKEKEKEYDKNFINKVKEDIDALKRLSSFIKNGPAMDLMTIFSESVDIQDKKNAPVYSRLATSIASMDIILAPFRKKGSSSPDFQFMLDALFSVLGGGEYMEFMDPVKERQLFGTKIKEDESTGSYISMLPQMLANNTSASRIFSCGMDASMDKPEVLSYPAAIATELKLPQRAELKEKKLKKFAHIVESAAELHASYAYLDFGSKVLGISNAAKLLPDIAGMKIVKNDDNSLMRSYDIIKNGKFAPDESYKYIYDASKAVKFNDKKSKSMPKIKELFNNPEGKPIVRVTQLADFVTCPRRLVHSLISDNAGLEEGSMEFRMKGKKGNFWHKVYELAAREQKLFNSTKQGDIEKAMLIAVDAVIAEKKLDPEAIQEKSEKEFLADTKMAKIPVFALNEADRKKRLSGLKTEMPEIKLAFDAGSFLLEGTMDRLDVAGDTAILWDYKTGESKNKTSFSFLSGKSKFAQKNYAGDNRKFDSANGRDAVQLAVYTYLLSQTKVAELKVYKSLQKAAGIIYLDGTDNLDDIELIKQQWPETMPLLERTINVFSEFIEESADILESSGATDTGLIRDSQPCAYCEFNKNCEMLLMKGGA
jgi:RecB family exonuclease